MKKWERIWELKLQSSMLMVNFGMFIIVEYASYYGSNTISN